MLARKAVLVALVLSAGASGLVLFLLNLAAVPLLGRDFSDVSFLFAIMVPGVVLFAPVRVMASYATTVLLWPTLSTIVVFVWTAADMLLLLWLAPSMGATGAAIASSASYSLGAVFMGAVLLVDAKRRRKDDSHVHPSSASQPS